MLHSVAAVVAGFVVMALIVMVGTMVMAAMFIPGGIAAMRGGGAAMPPPPIAPRYLAMNLTLSLVAAIVGGWLTARMASDAPVVHVEALCALILVMGLVSAFTPGSERQPRWYTLLIPFVGAAGAAAGLLLVVGS